MRSALGNITLLNQEWSLKVQEPEECVITYLMTHMCHHLGF